MVEKIGETHHGILGFRLFKGIMYLDGRFIDYGDLNKFGGGYWFDKTSSHMKFLRCHNVLLLILGVFEMNY